MLATNLSLAIAIGLESGWTPAEIALMIAESALEVVEPTAGAEHLTELRSIVVSTRHNLEASRVTA